MISLPISCIGEIRSKDTSCEWERYGRFQEKSYTEVILECDGVNRGSVRVRLKTESVTLKMDLVPVFHSCQSNASTEVEIGAHLGKGEWGEGIPCGCRTV